MDKMKWSEITPLQRNALIAEKVMGWQWIAYNFYDVSSTADQLWLLPDDKSTAMLTPGEWTYYEEDTEGHIIGNRYLPYWISDYSTDMNAAWQIVEKLYNKDMDVSLYISTGEDKYFVSVWAEAFEKLAGIGRSNVSMPDAICLAVLNTCNIEVG